MAAPSSKPFKTIDQLTDLLIEERGLNCQDSNALKEFLTNMNYYRFSGYARHWQEYPRHGKNNFMPSTNFSHICEIMLKDHQLRHLLLEQISYVETATKTRYAHALGQSYGNGAFYLKPELYFPNTTHDGEPINVPGGLLSDIQRSNSKMILHYRSDHLDNAYAVYEKLPIWVAVEVISLGKFSRMLSDFKDNGPAKAVTSGLGIQWVPFPNTLHSISTLRNRCAHHSQLWHRPLDIAAPVPKKLRPKQMKYSNQSVFSTIIMLNDYRKHIDGDTSVSKAITDLIGSDSDYQEGICYPSPK